MNKFLVVLVVTMLGACSPGHIASNNNGKAEYVWIGCHVVTQSPKHGAYAIGPGGDLEIGDTFYFKQVGHDGKVGEVVTGKPCED